ncbi:MAG: CocE/NonD family hydrolase, partial [Moraxellaceae bacterium]|nr:CocE/NonD family hydrolase [Moraxellaceae bacterium]
CGRAPLFRSVGLDFGRLRVSEATPFEAPDPGHWAPRGFAVIHVDGRGSGASEGKLDPLGDRTISDYCEVLAWASRQPWCNGRVATMGVSYLAVAQWFVAERQPEALAAMAPWEGFNDVYRDLMFHGGIPETGFVGWWLRGDQNAAPPGSDDPPEFSAADPWYSHLPLPARALTGLALTQHFAPAIDRMALPRIDLTRIIAPALLCGSWSAQGIHSRGAFFAWDEISSIHKELFTHGRHEWTVAYSPEALAAQEAFLTRHLKATGPVVANPAPVRVEILQDRDRFTEFQAADWPLPQARMTSLYMGEDEHLHAQPPPVAAQISWRSDSDEQVVFRYRFLGDAQLCGPMQAILFFQIDQGEDADLFLGICKEDPQGRRVPVYNFLKRDELMAHGWLRASHRALDPIRSRPWRPVLSHAAPAPLQAGPVYRLDMEILPAGMAFEAGSALCLIVSGRDIIANPNCQHKRLRNSGRHRLMVGGETASQLIVPLLTARPADKS